jgi:DNA-binding NarL/FixJ family response regulator
VVTSASSRTGVLDRVERLGRAGLTAKAYRERVLAELRTVLSLRADRMTAASEGEGDAVVTIAVSTPAERREVFALAHGLTAREREVLAELARGLDSHAIAERLFLSDHTVHDHVKSVLAKTGTPSRQALLSRIAGAA